MACSAVQGSGFEDSSLGSCTLLLFYGGMQTIIGIQHCEPLSSELLGGQGCWGRVPACSWHDPKHVSGIALPASIQLYVLVSSASCLMLKSRAHGLKLFDSCK